MINFFKRTCYVSMPVIITLILIGVNHFIKIPLNYDKLETMIGIIGTLIGFLLTAITIFTSLPKNNIIMKKAINFNHHKIFSKCILLGIFFSILTILLWVIDFNIHFIYLSFLISFLETIMASWYIYRFCLFSIN